MRWAEATWPTCAMRKDSHGRGAGVALCRASSAIPCRPCGRRHTTLHRICPCERHSRSLWPRRVAFCVAQVGRTATRPTAATVLRPGRLAGYRAGDRTAAGTRRCWYYQQRPVDRIRPLARPQPAPHPRPGLSQAAPCLRPRCVARGVSVGHTALTPSVPVRSQLASAPPFVWVAAADGSRFRLTLARLG